MKFKKLLLLVVAFSVCIKLCAYKEQSIDIYVNGVKRNMLVYTPDAMSDNLPLMVVTHGMNQNPEYQSDGDRFRDIIDKEKFVVAYLRSNGSTWDIGGDGDTNFVLSAIDDMASRFKINTNRVYWSGFSMGTMLIYHSIGRLQGKIAAFAPTSGMAFTEQPWNALTQQINLIHCHSLSDNVFPLANYDFITYVTNIANKNGFTKHDIIQNYRAGDHVGTKDVWTDERTGKVVALFRYEWGGHWPTVNNRDEIWNFCKQFSLNGNNTDTPSPTYQTEAAVIGDANFNTSNGHYEFYKPSYSAFIFSNYKGTKLEDCADLTISLGDCTTGYRLDIQLKDAAGNIIKDGDNDYVIGSEAAGTRYATAADAKNNVINMQALFADYLAQYPGCTIGDIRINTAVAWGSDDNDKTGKYYITIDKMEMNVTQVEARKALHASLTDIPMYRYEEQKEYVFNNPSTLGGWGNATIANLGEGAYEITVSEKMNSWEGQFNIGDMDYADGKEYVLSLDIMGSVEGVLSTGIQNPDGYKDCGNFGTIPVTTDWKTFTQRATVSGANARRILINVGDYVGTLNIRNVQVYSIPGINKTEITGTNISLGQEKSNGGEIFGAGLAGYVNNNEYADLTSYDKMLIKGTGDDVRILYNRPDMNSCPEIRQSLKGGSITIDLTEYPYFHLNSIKAAWGQTVNVESILLSKNDAPEGFADYYITGAGRVSQSATDALGDLTATSIDITGMNNKFEQVLQASNPNCLMFYSEAQGNAGLVGNVFGARNMVKIGGDYSSWTTTLTDGYDFHSPININTVGGASYSRQLSANEYANIVLPFELDLDNSEKKNPEIYVINAVNGGNVILTQVTSGKIPAGTAIIYRQVQAGIVTLNGSGIAKTPNGLNIQPISGVVGWYTAQSFQHGYIDNVSAHSLLKDYNVYTLSEGKLQHVASSLTLEPFRAYYLQAKSAAPAASTLYILDASFDVNNDGKISIDDLVLLISYFNGKSGAYDTSKVKTLKVSDLQTIINILVQ